MIAYARVRRSTAPGFTMLELLIVFVTLAILTSIMVRGVRGTWLASSRRSATRDATAYLVRARTVAIQQSRRSWLVRNGNVLKILVDSSGTAVQLGTTVDFSQKYSATLAASPSDTIAFDPRGFAANLTLNPKLIMTLNSAADTICVTGLGKITTRSCP